MNQSTEPIRRIGVVGAGTMGRGIAQIAAVAGVHVIVFDASVDVAREARAFARKMLMRAVEKGRISAGEADSAVARISVCDNLAALGGSDLVVEAIPEKLELKQRVFQELENLVSEDCILATNTSSLSVASIASPCRYPGRVAGLHFFNPVPLMKVVEVIGGVRTEARALDRLVTLVAHMGHRPIRVADTPGFLINHAGRAFVTEGLRIVEERVADFADIDRVLREAAGFRLGPFELLDLTGLDVSHTVTESIYEQFYHEPRIRPSVVAQQRLAGNLLGRKTGQGFYHYIDGHLVTEPELAAPEIKSTVRVWVGGDDAEVAAPLRDMIRAANFQLDMDNTPAAGSLCVVAPLGRDATTTAIDEGLDPKCVVAIDALLPLDRRRTLMTTPVTRPEYRDAAHALFASDGTPVTVIADSVGFIAQRVLASIVNIACDIAQRGTTVPEDIDEAVVLGLGYPIGPLALGDRIGPERVLRILDGMLDFYADPRYRASPWLRRRAVLGTALTTAFL